MEAGSHMKQFCDDLFISLDKGKSIDNSVMLNAHLLQSIEGICSVKGVKGHIQTVVKDEEL